jgi:hypothetical protein
MNITKANGGEFINHIGKTLTDSHNVPISVLMHISIDIHNTDNYVGNIITFTYLKKESTFSVHLEDDTKKTFDEAMEVVAAWMALAGSIDEPIITEVA